MTLFERLTALFRPWTLGPEDKFPDLQTSAERVPEDLSPLLSREAYGWILGQTMKHLGGGRHVYRLEGGLLFYSEVDGVSWAQLNLVHMVQQLLAVDKATWKEGIARYVDRHRKDQEALEALLVSFEAARDRLTVRLHSKATYERFPLGAEGYLLKGVIPELYAALALELPGHFHILQRSEISHWGIDEDELFWTAYTNLLDKKDTLKVIEQAEEGYSLVVMLEENYAASFVADFGNL